MSDIQHDPACRDCRAVAGRENANTTWQCAAHVIAERDRLRGEVMSLRRWRTEQDCRYTLGTVADIDGSHCPSDKPCERCQSERERDRLRARVEGLRAYIDSQPYQSDLDGMRMRAEAAEAERDRLREAIQRALDCRENDWDGCWCGVMALREALGVKP